MRKAHATSAGYAAGGAAYDIYYYISRGENIILIYAASASSPPASADSLMRLMRYWAVDFAHLRFRLRRYLMHHCFAAFHISGFLFGRHYGLWLLIIYLRFLMSDLLHSHLFSPASTWPTSGCHFVPSQFVLPKIGRIFSFIIISFARFHDTW